MALIYTVVYTVIETDGSFFYDDFSHKSGDTYVDSRRHGVNSGFINTLKDGNNT
jgi:hypothetical protein